MGHSNQLVSAVIITLAPDYCNNIKIKVNVITIKPSDYWLGSLS